MTTHIVLAEGRAAPQQVAVSTIRNQPGQKLNRSCGAKEDHGPCHQTRELWAVPSPAAGKHRWFLKAGDWTSGQAQYEGCSESGQAGGPSHCPQAAHYTSSKHRLSLDGTLLPNLHTMAWSDNKPQDTEDLAGGTGTAAVQGSPTGPSNMGTGNPSSAATEVRPTESTATQAGRTVHKNYTSFYARQSSLYNGLTDKDDPMTGIRGPRSESVASQGTPSACSTMIWWPQEHR